jgi:hypothetical protein
MTDTELNEFTDKLFDVLAELGVKGPAALVQREADGSITMDVRFTLEG